MRASHFFQASEWNREVEIFKFLSAHMLSETFVETICVRKISCSNSEILTVFQLGFVIFAAEILTFELRR